MINIDNNDSNADWIKSRTWDLPRTVEGVLSVIGRDKWEHFKTLPAYKACPPHLAHDIDAYIKANPVA